MPSDATRGPASHGRAWLFALIPVLPSLLIVAALWGSFSTRLSVAEGALHDATTRLNEMDKVIVDLRIAVSNLTVEVAALNATLRQREDARR